MAEPARQLDPQSDDSEAPPRHLSSVPTGGEGGGPISSRENLSAVPDLYDKSGTEASDPKPDLAQIEKAGGDSPSEEKRSGHDEASTDDLSQKENSGAGNTEPKHENQVGRGYSSKSQDKIKTSVLSRFSPRQKILGATGGLLIAGFIALLSFLLPALRLEGYLATINARVFASASDAVSNRVQHLFENYMIGYVTALDKCGGKITVECRANYSNSGIASSLFKSWQDARIEQTLFDKYGFEIISLKNPDTSTPSAKRFTIKDRLGHEMTLTNGDLQSGRFTGGSREFGNEINKFLKDNTRWYDVMQRRSVRKYMVRKHGVKFWCFWACETKDAIDNSALDINTKFKAKLIERIIYPFSTKYGLIMDCIVSGDPAKCSPDNLEKMGLDRSTLSEQDLADIKNFEDNPNSKLSQYLIEKLLVKMGMDQVVAHGVVSGIPVAGQVYLGLSALDTLEQTKNFIEDGTLSKIAANINAAQYFEYYTAMRSANDEMKAGVLSADEVGPLVSQFNDGGQSAEQSLVYQAYTNTNGNKTAISGTAYAAAQPAQISQPPYLCANGQPIPSGQLVCPEKTLDQRTFKIEKYFKDSEGVINTLNLYEKCYLGGVVLGRCVGFRPSTDVHNALKGINWIINNTLGTVLSGVLASMKAIPGLSDLINLLQDEASKVINALFQEVFPLPVQPDSPGRDKYDGLEAGGEVAASEFGKGGYTDSGQPYGLGGKLLSSSEQSAVLQDYSSQENYLESHSGIIARITDMQNPSSLTNRFVGAMPASFGQLSQSFLAIMSHPLNGLHFSLTAHAATNVANINAFGVPRFGYAPNDPVFSADPSLYTDQYCTTIDQTWQSSKTTDPITGIDEYSTTDPCLLERVSVEAASSVFTGDDSLND